MKQLISRLLFAYRYRRAVREANDCAHLTGRKHYVINLNGKLQVTSKQSIVHLIRTHRFRHGVKVADIERRALYITHINS